MTAPVNRSIDWDDLKYVLAVARTGTLRAAAQSIQVNHSTITRRLSVIEEHLGGRLFDRSKSGLALNDLGKKLLPHAVKVEEEFHAISRAVVGQDNQLSGAVTVSMPHGLAMTSIMDDFAQFSALYPSIELVVRPSDSIVDLSRRDADISIRASNDVMDDVIGTKLVSTSQAAYCNKDYVKRVRDTAGKGLHMLGWNEPLGDNTAGWVRDTYYPKAELRHRVADMISRITLVQAGLGMTYLGCAIGDRQPGLVRAPFQKPIPYRDLWLLLHPDLKKTARVRILVDYLVEQIRSRRSEFWVPGTATVKEG